MRYRAAALVGVVSLWMALAAPVRAQLTCNAADKCNPGVCSNGACAETPVVCPTPTDKCHVVACNSSTGACDTTVITDADCDDGNPCTADSCNPSIGCLHVPDVNQNGQSCDTGNPCKNTGTCSAGLCLATNKADNTPCGTANLCFELVCQSGFCGFHPLVTCTAPDNCTFSFCNPSNGMCQNVANTCDDGNPCTSDSCNPATGCVNTAVQGTVSCDDGNECTGPDMCQGDTCAGAPLAAGGTATPTDTPTSAPTATNTAPPTVTHTPVPSATNTTGPTATNTTAPTATSTSAATGTNTAVPSATTTGVPSATPTNTVAATATGTAPPSATHTAAPSATNTALPTPTQTAAPSATATSTTVPVATATSTPVPTPLLAVLPPQPHDFGTVPGGTSASFKYTVQNAGGGTLIGTAGTPCDGFSVSPTDFSLGAGATAILTITFTPPGEGTFTCQLVIESNGGSTQIDLSANGGAPAAIPIVASPTTPAGAAMIALVAAGMGWLLRTRRPRRAA